MKKLRVLYAEDNAVDADLTLAHFKDSAPDVVLDVLESGEPCEERLGNTAFDLLLLDNHLPDVDGVEVLRRLRRAGHRLPVVMLTGSGDERTVASALVAGADDYVTKGGDYLLRLPDLLREVVERVNLRDEDRVPTTSARKTRRALCVESDPKAADAVRLTLEKDSGNCQVEIVADLSVALQRMKGAGRYDVLLLGTRQDEESLDLFKRVRREHPVLPIIVIAETGEEGTAIALLRLGATDILPRGEGYLAFLPSAVERSLQRAQVDRTNQRLRDDLATMNLTLEQQVRDRTAALEQESQERRRAQDDVLAAAARYANALENMMEGCQIISRDWDYLFVNPAAARHGRKGRHELVGRRMVDVYPGIDATPLFGHLSRCMNERTPIQTENQFVYEDGQHAWFDLRIEPVPEGVFVLTIDITARKLVEQDAAETRDDLAVTLQSIGDGVIATDPLGRVSRMNPTAERLTGWNLEEAIGKPLNEVFQVADADTRAALQSPLFSSGEKVGLADRSILIARDGTEYRIANAAAPIRGAEGGVRGVVLTFRDETKEFRNQQSLRDREAQLSRIADAIPGPVSQMSGDGRYLFANTTFCRWTGRKMNEILGHTLAEVMDPARLESALPFLRRVGGGEVVTYETQFQGIAGDRRQAVMTLIPDVNSEGKRSGFIAVGTDITARKAAEDRVRKSEELFRLASSTARLGAWSIDRADGTLIWTDEVFAIHGLPVGAAPGAKEALTFYAARSRAAIRRALINGFERGVPFDLSAELKTANGQMVWVRLTGQPERDAFGTVVRIQGAIQDIDQVKRGELRISEQLQELLRWQAAMVNRESRTLQLKAEVNALRAKLNLPPAYDEAVAP